MSETANPLVGFSYGIDVAGTITGFFTKCEGLGSSTSVVDHKVVDASGRDAVQKIPGRLEWGDITLSRGITANMDFWKWRKQVEEGKVAEARKNGSIIMYDQTNTEVARWNFVNGWPSKLDGPSLSSEGNEVSVESLTIVHEGIERIS
jgi:phage tail-like protein